MFKNARNVGRRGHPGRRDSRATCRATTFPPSVVGLLPGPVRRPPFHGGFSSPQAHSVPSPPVSPPTRRPGDVSPTWRCYVCRAFGSSAPGCARYDRLQDFPSFPSYLPSVVLQHRGGGAMILRHRGRCCVPDATREVVSDHVSDHGCLDHHGGVQTYSTDSLSSRERRSRPAPPSLSSPLERRATFTFLPFREES